MANATSPATKELLCLLDGLLRPHGFARRGSTFSRSADNGRLLHLVAVQRSSKSTAINPVVTLNFGVTALAGLNSWDSPSSIASSHWTERIGFVGSPPEDRWWYLGEAGSVGDAFAELRSLLPKALTLLDSFSTVEALLSALDGGVGRGRTPEEQALVAKKLRSSLGDVPPNPSLQRTSPGRSPGFGR